MATTKFSPKDPAETVLVTFDYVNLMTDQTEVLTSADWFIDVFEGTDASPELMLEGLPTLGDTSTTRLIKGGIDGVIYHIHAICSTNKSQVLKLTGSMEIKTQV